MREAQDLFSYKNSGVEMGHANVHECGAWMQGHVHIFYILKKTPNNGFISEGEPHAGRKKDWDDASLTLKRFCLHWRTETRP